MLHFGLEFQIPMDWRYGQKRANSTSLVYYQISLMRTHAEAVLARSFVPKQIQGQPSRLWVASPAARNDGGGHDLTS